MRKWKMSSGWSVQTHRIRENGVTQAGLLGHFLTSQGSYTTSFSSVFSKHLCFLSPIHCFGFKICAKCEMITQSQIWNTRWGSSLPGQAWRAAALQVLCRVTSHEGKFLQKLLRFLHWPLSPRILPNALITFKECLIKNPTKESLTNLKFFLIHLGKTHNISFLVKIVLDEIQNQLEGSVGIF